MRFFKYLSAFLVFIVLSLVLVGCKPTIPDRYLQPKEMADILYDYHLAEGIASNAAVNDTIALRSFKTSILIKHGITEAELDSSMVYYVRHTKMLADVYKMLSDRINNEATAMGGSSIGMNDEMIGNGDTTNVWRQETSFILSPYALVNRKSVEIACDTAYHANDRLMLDFDTKYLYQDGPRDAKVVLAITYDNDSTCYVTNSISSSSHYHLETTILPTRNVKMVRVLWLMNIDSQTDDISKQTLRLLFISNVRFIRMRTHLKPNDVGPIDSLQSSAKNESTPKLQLMNRPIPNK